MEIDAYIDPLTGDLPITSRLSTGAELIQQRITVRLRRGRGEYLLDPGNIGLPLVEWASARPPPLEQIMSAVMAEVRSVPGVVGTENWTSSFDIYQRRVTVSGDVRFDDGSISSMIAIGSSQMEANEMAFGVYFSGGRRINWSR